MTKPTLIAVGDCNALSKEGVDARQFRNDMTLDVFARTIWGEARGEGEQGMQAVANVIMNRVKHAQDKGRFWWGSSIIQVCQKPYQFSCWNRSDQNFKKLQNIGANNLYFATAMRIANRTSAGCLPDITSGATHYHTKSIKPYWAKGEKHCAEIGSHVFYRLV